MHSFLILALQSSDFDWELCVQGDVFVQGLVLQLCDHMITAAGVTRAPLALRMWSLIRGIRADGANCRGSVVEQWRA